MSLVIAVAVFAATQVLAPSVDFEKAQCLVESDGGIVCGFGCVESPSGKVRCAQEPGGTCAVNVDASVVCAKALGISLRLPLVPAQCLKGANGRVACGYACVVGGDGRSRCANTPDGACAVAPSGKALCTKFDAARRTILLLDQVKPQCVRETDGGVACGYQCVKASTGQARCANTPDGACAQSTDGTVACTGFDPTHRLYVGDPPKSQCLTGAAGFAACGYGCVRDTVGRARCSESPFGACAVKSDGHVRCFPEDQETE